MPQGKIVPGREVAVFQSEQWRRDTLLGHRSGGSRLDQIIGERRGTSGGYEEEMKSRSNDLSCSANESPCGTAGSNSTFTKSLRNSVSGHHTKRRRSREQQQILCQQRLVHRPTSHKAPKSPEGAVEHQQSLETRLEASLWSMITHHDDVPDPHQGPAGGAGGGHGEAVLQPLQPWVTQEQREELAKVHPWVQQHPIPPEIHRQDSVSCSPGRGMVHLVSHKPCVRGCSVQR